MLCVVRRKRSTRTFDAQHFRLTFIAEDNHRLTGDAAVTGRAVVDKSAVRHLRVLEVRIAHELRGCVLRRSYDERIARQSRCFQLSVRCKRVIDRGVAVGPAHRRGPYAAERSEACVVDHRSVVDEIRAAGVVGALRRVLYANNDAYLHTGRGYSGNAAVNTTYSAIITLNLTLTQNPPSLT